MTSRMIKKEVTAPSTGIHVHSVLVVEMQSPSAGVLDSASLWYGLLGKGEMEAVFECLECFVGVS